MLVDGDGLADDLGDGHARVERSEGILEDDLHLAAGVAQGAGVQCGQLLAVVADTAAGGFDKAQQEAAEGAFAATALANQAEGLARLNAEADIVHGAHWRLSGGELKLLDEMGGFDQCHAQERIMRRFRQGAVKPAAC